MPTIRWHDLDEDVRQAYARNVALFDSQLRQELGVGGLSEVVVFYNAYYWALVFAKRYQDRYGFDAGIEQEAFKVLERAPADVDWQTVERVNLQRNKRSRVERTAYCPADSAIIARDFLLSRR